MLRTWLTTGVLVMGLSLVGCGDGGHDDGDLSGAGDNLKGRDKETKPTEKDGDGSPAEDEPKDEPKDEDASACAAILCPTNTKCVVKEVQCIRAPCPPIASCEPIDAPATCAATLCREGTTCVEGPNGAECVEPNGAGTCAATLCKEGTECVEGSNGAECVERTSGPGCAVILCRAGTACIEDKEGARCVEQQKCTAKCSAGQHCELQEVVCIKAPCLPVPTCVDDVVDACATVKCKAGTHCVSTQPACFTTPCPPFAECVPN
jgi:hypothetical protein